MVSFSTSLIYTGFWLNYSLDYRKNRLRLSAMQEDGAQHRFTYDTAAFLPLKSSFGQDYWEGFNNQEEIRRADPRFQEIFPGYYPVGLS